MNRAELFQLPYVCGSAIGFKKIGGQRTDRVGLTVFVTRKVQPRALAPHQLVPTRVEGMETDVVTLRAVPFKQFRTTWWPVAPPGVSCGHFAISAGTLGLFMRHADREETMVLSNNHVLADTNRATHGQRIHQPGPYDEPPQLSNAFAQLYDFEFIQFLNQPGPPDECGFAKAVAATFNAVARFIGSKTVYTVTDRPAADPVNYIDAAIATVDREDKIETLVLDDQNVPSIKVIGFHKAGLGDFVFKSGRTTELTHGQITGVDTIVDVSYGPGQVARFMDQLIIEPLPNDLRAFSAGGDSGSVILTEDENELTGLLFAGDESQNITIANTIERVLARFPLSL